MKIEENTKVKMIFSSFRFRTAVVRKYRWTAMCQLRNNDDQRLVPSAIGLHFVSKLLFSYESQQSSKKCFVNRKSWSFSIVERRTIEFTNISSNLFESNIDQDFAFDDEQFGNDQTE